MSLEFDRVLTNIIEEVDLLLLCEECSTNTMHRCIAPSLKEMTNDRLALHTITKTIRRGPYLIVETTLLIKEVEELAVCFASPEIQVTNLKVTPDYTGRERVIITKAKRRNELRGKLTYSDICCMCFRRRLRGSPYHCRMGLSQGSLA